MKLASYEACQLGQNYVKPEHLLLGILAESADIPALAEKGALGAGGWDSGTGRAARQAALGGRQP